MKINDIQSDKVRAVLTGSATPAAEINAMWAQLTEAEQIEASSLLLQPFRVERSRDRL